LNFIIWVGSKKIKQKYLLILNINKSNGKKNNRAWMKKATLRCLLSDEAVALYITSEEENETLNQMKKMNFCVCREGYDSMKQGNNGERETPFLWKWSIIFFFFNKKNRNLGWLNPMIKLGRTRPTF
jgi:hypothetical protein